MATAISTSASVCELRIGFDSVSTGLEVPLESFNEGFKFFKAL